MNIIDKYLFPSVLIFVLLLSACKSDEKNHAPVAFNASVTGQADTELKGQLMANDKEGDRLIFSLVSPPVKGTLTMNANGKFTYKPEVDTTGTDQFTFSVSDKTQTSNVATVNITISELELAFSNYSRQVYSQASAAQPLSVNSRNLQQDVLEETAYDDLLQ
ncbi:MAG TPA: Ig-like domain-containing protein [Cellvibrio sp.]|nr:Ig-like domain-containing protein [Cellvibrio sp.]